MKSDYSHLTDKEIEESIILWSNERQKLDGHLKTIQVMDRIIQALLDEQQTRLLNNHK